MVEHAARRTPASRALRLRLSPGSLRLLLTAVTAAAVVGALQSFVLAPLTGHFTGAFEDFGVYLDGGRAANAGTSPYAGFDGGTITMSGFDYPPLDAWLFRPLALLPYHVAQMVWLWVGLACAVGGSVIVARAVLPRTWPSVRLGISAALLFAPATYNLWHGQVNPLIFLLLALAMRSWVRGEQGRCGTLLGIAAAVKLAPLVLVVMLLRRRWWRGAAAMAATMLAASLAGVLLIGSGATRTFLTTVFPALNRDNGWVYNQTWNGVVSRLADHAVFAWATPSTVIHLVALLLGAAGLLWAARSVRPGERPGEVRGAEFGAGIAAMLLCGSVAWIPHDIHLLIPLFAALGLVAVHGRRAAGSVRVGLIAAVLALAVLTPLLIAGSSMPSLLAASHGRWWWFQLQLWSAPALAAAVLLASLGGWAARAGHERLPGAAGAPPGAPRTLVGSA
jgi:alpha-1,2-mannosyltransferase